MDSSTSTYLLICNDDTKTNEIFTFHKNLSTFWNIGLLKVASYIEDLSLTPIIKNKFIKPYQKNMLTLFNYLYNIAVSGRPIILLVLGELEDVWWISFVKTVLERLDNTKTCIIITTNPIQNNFTQYVLSFVNDKMIKKPNVGVLNSVLKCNLTIVKVSLNDLMTLVSGIGGSDITYKSFKNISSAIIESSRNSINLDQVLIAKN